MPAELDVIHHPDYLRTTASIIRCTPTTGSDYNHYRIRNESDASWRLNNSTPPHHGAVNFLNADSTTAISHVTTGGGENLCEGPVKLLLWYGSFTGLRSLRGLRFAAQFQYLDPNSLSGLPDFLHYFANARSSIFIAAFRLGDIFGNLLN